MDLTSTKIESKLRQPKEHFHELSREERKWERGKLCEVVGIQHEFIAFHQHAMISACRVSLLIRWLIH